MTDRQSHPHKDGTSDRGVIHVRPYRNTDAACLAHVFDRAVREGTVGAYDEAQRAAWASAPQAPPDWAERLGEEITVVAERDGVVAGFMTLGRDGFLDLAFVLPEAMGTGVASALHDRILAEAEARGMSRLKTDASHIARRFFLKQGWSDLGETQVELGGAKLPSFGMEKRLRVAGVKRS